MFLTATLDLQFFFRFVISELKNLPVTVSKRIRAKLLKFHQKIMHGENFMAIFTTLSVVIIGFLRAHW